MYFLTACWTVYGKLIIHTCILSSDIMIILFILYGWADVMIGVGYCIIIKTIYFLLPNSIYLTYICVQIITNLQQHGEAKVSKYSEHFLLLPGESLNSVCMHCKKKFEGFFFAFKGLLSGSVTLQ